MILIKAYHQWKLQILQLKARRIFFETCKLDSNFKAINIDEQYFDIMAAKSCNNDVLHGFKPLKQEDIKKYIKCV